MILFLFLTNKLEKNSFMENKYSKLNIFLYFLDFLQLCHM